MNFFLKFILVLLLSIAAVFLMKFSTRLVTIMSISQISDQTEDGLYSMNVSYKYSLENLTPTDIDGDEDFVKTIVEEAIPWIPVKMDVRKFGCSAFKMQDKSGAFMMGRNYDFKFDTSCMLVRCKPEDGYASIAFAALDNLKANTPLRTLKSKISCLAAPFICLDGINEKGVSIAVLTLDSPPAFQRTAKPVLGTSILIRLVLDKAATTEEAIQLISKYDAFSANGRDYHFFITDASGDSRVVEFDCDDPARETVVTRSDVVTNFFICHMDSVLPYQKNGLYGHGKERYDKIVAVMDENDGKCSRYDAWKALKEASQAPKEGDVTSNTQWSILYNNTSRTAEICQHRNWSSTKTFKID